MTMLDRMRRHKNWLKWSLALVCLAFVVFYIPEFMSGTGTDAAPGETVATIEGQAITAGEFRRLYQAQVQAYRSAYGGQMSDQLLRQLGVEQQILQQLVDERAALAEADRLDIHVSIDEIRQQILSMPAFQENGQFIGEQRYTQLLRAQRPPMTPPDFEDNVRRSLIIAKLRASLTDWMSVPDAELEREYRRRNDKVKLALVNISADSFRPQVTVTDQDVSAHFEAHQTDFKIPEKRKIRYLLVDVDALRVKTTVSAGDIERAYNASIEQYSSPEQIRASHILLRTEGKDELAVRAKAEELLKQARSGADFGELARKNSEDEASAKNDGDLDYFGRGRMVPEFEQVAFSLEPGQVSDLVKTSYGFHIIKLIDKKPGTTRPIAEVRQQISDQLAAERAQAQAANTAQAMAAEISRPSDLDKAAGARGLTVQESAFFARDEPTLALGASPEAAAQVFEMSQGEVRGPLQTSRGFVWVTIVGRQDPYVPKLDEVRDRVREALIREKARELSRQRARQILATLRNAPDFDKAAKAAGVEPKTTELITRESPLPDVGIAPAVDQVAFTLPVGASSEPIATDSGTTIIKVLEKQEVTAAEIAGAKDKFRDELLGDRRNRFFSAYMQKAKQRMKIQLNRETLQRIVG
jgi:peptidyl-prolyl cis-trans isomerase D